MVTQLFLCPFPSAVERNKAATFKANFALLQSAFSSPWELYFLRQKLLFTQFFLTPMQNVTVAVFSLSYNYFSTVFQVLTRNICQKCFPYWVLVLVFHLLGLCSPYSNTFEFYISHLIRPDVSFCICWV